MVDKRWVDLAIDNGFLKVACTRGGNVLRVTEIALNSIGIAAGDILRKVNDQYSLTRKMGRPSVGSKVLSPLTVEAEDFEAIYKAAKDEGLTIAEMRRAIIKQWRVDER
jgi:hypothetical protein